MSQSVGSERRADIQILRAVAVLAVMLAHFGGLLAGGFLGVDIFFVISGFVITLSLLRLRQSRDNARALLREFWLRRFWRLAPPLVVVLVVTVILTATLLPPEEFADQVHMSVWSLFFAGNIGVEVIWTADYFDPGATQNWLLHLWSLGVEEQFYLAFPFLFLALFGFRGVASSPAKSFGVLGLTAAASFALALINDVEELLGRDGRITEMTGFASLLGYYSPATRAWQFLAGVMAALLIHFGLAKAQRSLTIVGALALVASLVLVPESNLLPGPLTLIPMAAMCVLLISPAPASWAEHRVAQPLRWLGDRSYSAYLWHWPVWLSLEGFMGTNPASIALAFVLTALLADRSYVWIEQRLKYRGAPSSETSPLSSRRLRRVFVAAVLPLPLVIGPGVLALNSALEQSGVLRTAPAVPRIDETRDCVQVSCEDADIDVLLIGDSHSGALATAFFDQMQARGHSAYGAVIARHWGCLHLPGEEIVSIHEECRELSAGVRELIRTNPPDVAVLYGYTAGRFTAINSGGDSPISLRDAATGVDITDEATALARYDDALHSSVAVLTDLGIEVVIVTGTPDFSLRPEEANGGAGAASQAQLLLAPWVDFEFGQTITKDSYLARHSPFQAIEQQLAAEDPLVHYVDTWSYLCDETLCSQSTESGEFLYSDQDHVSPLGAQLLAAGVAGEMERWGLVGPKN